MTMNLDDMREPNIISWIIVAKVNVGESEYTRGWTEKMTLWL